MFASECGDAVAAMLARVNLAARTHETCRQDSENAGEHALAAESGLSQVTRNGAAHLWNRLSKFFESLEFSELLGACVVLVIDVLPASGRVFANRLNPSVSGGIDRHVSPRWRDF